MNRKKGHSGRRLSWSIAIYGVSLLSFLIAGIYFGVFAVTAQEPDFMPALQCLAGAAFLHVPFAFEKIVKLRIPSLLKIVFDLFLIGSILCGTVLAFFSTIPYWDDVMHFTSGTMTGIFGYLLLRHALRHQAEVLSPWLAAFGAVCFAMLVGSVWEIYEYAVDGLAGMNMQRFQAPDGAALAGRAALYDTMKDMIVDFCGALAAGISVFFHRRAEVKKSG